MYINKIFISMEGLFVLNMHFTRELNLSHCEFESCLWQGVLDTTLCDKDCQRPAIVRCFFLLALQFPPPIKLTSTIYLNYC